MARCFFSKQFLIKEARSLLWAAGFSAAVEPGLPIRKCPCGGVMSAEHTHTVRSETHRAQQRPDCPPADTRRHTLHYTHTTHTHCRHTTLHTLQTHYTHTHTLQTHYTTHTLQTTLHIHTTLHYTHCRHTTLHTLHTHKKNLSLSLSLSLSPLVREIKIC